MSTELPAHAAAARRITRLAIHCSIADRQFGYLALGFVTGFYPLSLPAFEPSVSRRPFHIQRKDSEKEETR